MREGLVWAASLFSPSKERVGCGGLGIWYKHRRFLPEESPLRRGSGGAEDGVKCEPARGTVFPGAQVLPHCAALETLGYQDAQHRTEEASLVPQPVTWKCFAGPCVRRLHPSPAAPATALAQLPLATVLSAPVQEAFQPTLLLTCLCAAMLWPVCHGKRQCPSLLETGVKLGEKGRPGVLTACDGAATAVCSSFHHGAVTTACLLRAHGLFLMGADDFIPVCNKQEGRSLPHA